VCCWLLFSAWLKFSLGLGQRPKSAFPRRSLRSLSTPNCRGQGHRQYATSLLLKLWLLMGARKKYMHPPVRLAWGDVSSQHGEGFTPCTCWQLEHSMYIVISELLTQLAIAVTLVPHKLGFPCKLKGANTARSERPEVQAQSSCFPSVSINNFHVDQRLSDCRSRCRAGPCAPLAFATVLVKFLQQCCRHSMLPAGCV
jgi:hypothetical protein